jgi:hypothetical protein
MVGAFCDRLDEFVRLGLEMGGEEKDLGHASFTVRALPYLPITFIIWQGDDEVPANGNILFDEGAIEWFCAEDLVVVAGMSVYEMLSRQRASRGETPR